ncbi:MAG TPA: hypothetical protein VHX88_02040 [Solirubrobacteraceae bacterium]|jgi:hypothetical protein|nr:hypothetical protein [Solirubrobacteraceae bacterium]
MTPRRAALGLTLALLLAGCGSSHHPTSPATAAQLLARSQAALGRVHSFHFGGTEASATGAITVSGTFRLPGGLSVTLYQGDQVAQFVVVGGRG